MLAAKQKHFKNIIAYGSLLAPAGEGLAASAPRTAGLVALSSRPARSRTPHAASEGDDGDGPGRDFRALQPGQAAREAARAAARGRRRPGPSDDRGACPLRPFPR